MKKQKKMTCVQAERYCPKVDFGLSDAQVEMRMQDGLQNQVKTNISKTYLKIVAKHVCTFFNLLCLICFLALVAVKAPFSDYSFTVIYLCNIVLGIIQEVRAKKTLDKLSIISSPNAKVIRGGKQTVVPVSDIVLDDVLILELGSQIPCDCVMLSGNLEVNESLLTGEAIPIKKTDGDKLLGGSFVVSGKCVCRVEKVGDECYAQQLSIKAKTHQSPNSKLLKAMNTIIKSVGIAIFPIATVMAIINYRALVPTYSGLLLARTVVTKTATVIIGMIPAGMFLLTTMALAVGVISLARVHTSVQDMYALEMLARVDVLCLDKTGTITDGKMKVKEVIELEKIDGLSISDAIFATENALNDSNQTSEALNEYFTKGKKLNAVSTLSFSSERKYSAATFENFGTFVIGAPNFIFHTLPNDIIAKISEHAAHGRRVLMLANSKKSLDGEKIPDDLTAKALIVIEDNVRPEAIETIYWFKQNDVAVKVISGDDPKTVSEIAKRAGVENAEKFVDLSGLDDEKIAEIADEYAVFGRVSPEQKAVLVKALKKKHTVAMTGDGVNDILAMKEADCSITVASGSSAAKSVAQLVLLDDNFNSMPKVVEEGRRVINNIQRSSALYLIKTLFTMTFALISIFRGAVYPFSPSMMIVLECAIIGIPSFFLSLQPNSNRVSGNFISQVFSNAVPGAMILVLNVLAMQYITKLLGGSISSELALSMEVLVLTFGGWVFLVKLCQPLDKYRGILVTVDTVVLLVWALFLMDSSFFNLASLMPLKDNWSFALIVICMIQLDFPLLTLFTKVFKSLEQFVKSLVIKRKQAKI